MISKLYFSGWLALFSIGMGVQLSNAQDSPDKITFDDHVKPVFQQRCATCHNSDRQSGGLDLTNFTNMMAGGGSGLAVEPGDASGSYLYMLITHEESPEMPPGGTKIPDADISVIESWINAGALENKKSVAKTKKKVVAAVDPTAGVRPEFVAEPPRMSLEPFFNSSRRGVVGSIATNPWTPLAALAATKQLLLYDTSNLQLIGSLPFPEGQANVIRFSRNGRLLMAGGGRHGLSGKVVVWDVATAERVVEIGSEMDNVLAADISADHTMIALGGPQKMLRVYSLETGDLLYEIKKHTDWITAIEFSPDGVLLASADRNGGLQIWESYSGNEYLTLGGHGKAITDMSWRVDSNSLATAGDDAAIRLWELENGRQIKSWTAHGQSVTGVKFKRNGQIVSCGRDRLAKLWQQDGKLVRQFEGLKEIGVAVAVCDESDVVISAGLDGSVFAWSADGAMLGGLESNPPPVAARLQNASTKLAEALAVVQPLETQLANLEGQLTEFTNNVQQEEATRDRFAAKLNNLKNQIESTNSEIEADVNQRKSWQRELTDTESAIPLVADAIKSAEAAVNLLPEDTELKSTFDQLSARHQQYAKRIGKLTTRIEESSKSAEDKKNLVVDLQSEVVATQSKLSGVDESLNRLRKELEPVQQQKDDLAAKLAAAKQNEAEYRASVDHWKAEIAFDAELNRLRQELVAAQNLIEEKNSVLESAERDLQNAQAEYDKKLSDKKDSEFAAAELKEKLRKLRTHK